MSPPRPTDVRRTLLLLLAASVASAAVLPWNLDAITSRDGFAAACRRLGDFLAAFATPDLGLGMLQRCAGLAAETLALAVLGTGLGLVLAYPLALGSCRGLLLGDGPHGAIGGRLRRLLLELCRLGLDALRGVPDFLWAIVLANFTGVNPVTGVLAIAISTAGIFGKVLGEQWDNIDPRRYAALRGTGAGPAAVFAYGLQPLAARAVLSFVLMRFECAVRNASVIGIFGGGGLGGALWDEYSDGNTARVATVLLALLAVTTVSDFAANLV
ncbi:MAG: ABC transporter permease subunit, partial [Planctomycetes bacterium]|nr:ABC transporter permease subunit [Planctomycetota bacterium]